MYLLPKWVILAGQILTGKSILTHYTYLMYRYIVQGTVSRDFRPRLLFYQEEKLVKIV